MYIRLGDGKTGDLKSPLTCIGRAGGLIRLVFVLRYPEAKKGKETKIYVSNDYYQNVMSCRLRAPDYQGFIVNFATLEDNVEYDSMGIFNKEWEDVLTYIETER